MARNSANKKLIAICSAAVICTAGITALESTHVMTARANNTPSLKTTSSNTTKSAPHKTAKTKTAPTKPVTKTAPTKPVKKQKYKDGTYTGVGQTRIGAVQVAVTLKQDKITKAEITGYSTHYSISYIDPLLPQELVARQDPMKIDVVSGATLSTEDFYYAVEQALQEAHQAEQHAQGTGS